MRRYSTDPTDEDRAIARKYVTLTYDKYGEDLSYDEATIAAFAHLRHAFNRLTEVSDDLNAATTIARARAVIDEWDRGWQR